MLKNAFSFIFLSLLFVKPSISTENKFIPADIVCQKGANDWPFIGANQILIQRKGEKVIATEYGNGVTRKDNQWTYKLIKFEESQGFQAYSTIGEVAFNGGALLFVTWAKKNDRYDKKDEIFGFLVSASVAYALNTKDLEGKVSKGAWTFACREL